MQHHLVSATEDFYNRNASDWDSHRQSPWQGWTKITGDVLSSFKANKVLNVLDLGCGNGRFLRYLIKEEVNFSSYLGVDIAANLIDLACKSFSDLPPDKGSSVSWLQADLTAEDTFEVIDQLSPSLRNYQLATLFAVLHHIPTQTTRIDLLTKVASRIKKGFLVFTLWNFLQDRKLAERSEPLIGKEVPAESGDFKVAWKSGESADWRYAHSFTEAEVNELEAALSRLGGKKVTQFIADGKSGSLNSYYVWQFN